MKRILFICKKNEIYGWVSYCRKSSGLFNSTHFIARSLVERGIDAKIIEVTDNNDIDREVSKFNPHIVVIEAFWVVPEKFDILKKLHPSVKWFIHLHSGIPFLSIEGIAVEWARGCADRGVKLIANSQESFDALKVVLNEGEELIFLPNVYIPKLKPVKKIDRDKHVLDIGCFGAVRPLKNPLIQALAAIQFANEMERPLRFHMNCSRVETGGEPVLKNIETLFKNELNATLVSEPWYEPADFLNLLRTKIDMALQVSLSETFNVVTADAVSQGVPVVVSKEVPWVSRWCVALDDDVNDIVSKMHRMWKWRIITRWNQNNLVENSVDAQQQWYEWGRRC